MGRTNRIITALVVLAVVAIGAVAVVAGSGEDSTAAGDRSPREESASRDLIGPHSPEPGALPGVLVVVRGENCVIQLVDLTRMRFSKAGPESGCNLVASPDGSVAAVVARGGDPEASEQRYELVTLSDEPETQTGLGAMADVPAWSPDGARIAACDPTSSSETTVVLTDGSPRQSVVGCWPAYSSAGALVTRTAADLTVELPTDGIYVEGEELVTLEEIVAAAAGSVEGQGFILGHATGADGVIAVSLAHATPDGDAQGSLQLWRGGAVSSVFEMPLFLDERDIPANITTDSLRDRLRLSPNADEVAIVLEDGAGELLVVDLESSTVLGPLEQSAFDWSPDGRWLAVATNRGIDVYGPSRDEEPTFQLPLITPALAWR
ncbi:MAG: hypothetical protein ACR2OD_13035 [Gaiellaceae bacterium]